MMLPEKSLPDDVKKQLLRQFESEFLPKMEIELRKLLDENEKKLLDSSEFEDVMGLFADILNNSVSIFLRDFFSSKDQVGSMFNVAPFVTALSLGAPTVTSLLGATTVGVAGGLAGGATTGIVVSGSTTGIVAGVATGAGVATSVATCGIGFAVGGLLAYCYYKVKLKSQLQRIKNQTLERWEKEIKPHLLEWFKERLDCMN